MLIGTLAKFKGKLAFLVDYHKYWIYHPDGTRSHNPARDPNTYRIMDLKSERTDLRDPEVARFAAELNPCIDSLVAIAVVPSHDPMKITSGIRLVAKKLAANKKRFDATACLVRTKLVAKKSAGGDRSKEVDLNSIRVRNREFIYKKRVLLLDDVTTTGNSFQACRQLLLDAGAFQVQCLAIGKTV